VNTIVLGGKKSIDIKIDKPQLVFNSICDADSNTKSLQVAQNIAKTLHDVPIVNHPQNILKTTRDAIYTLFKDTDAGQADINLGINFDRKRNQPVNPFKLTVNDVNLTETDLEVSGEENVGLVANYFFARARASRDFYDNITASSLRTPISVLVYCDKWAGCTALGIDTATGQTNDSKWWIASNHDEANGDGNITLMPATPSTSEGSGNPSVTANVTVVVNGQDPNINVTSNAINLPMTADIQLNTTGTLTNDWLTYDTNSALGAFTNPFYQVRFIDTSGWSGVGDTGHVLDTNASSGRIKRLNW